MTTSPSGSLPPRPTRRRALTSTSARGAACGAHGGCVGGEGGAEGWPPLRRTPKLCRHHPSRVLIPPDAARDPKCADDETGAMRCSAHRPRNAWPGLRACTQTEFDEKPVRPGRPPDCAPLTTAPPLPSDIDKTIPPPPPSAPVFTPSPLDACTPPPRRPSPPPHHTHLPLLRHCPPTGFGATSPLRPRSPPR